MKAAWRSYRVVFAAIAIAMGLLEGVHSPDSAELPPPLLRLDWATDIPTTPPGCELGAVAVAGDGKAFVIDHWNSRILRFNDRNGTLDEILPFKKDSLCTFGRGPDELAVGADLSLYVLCNAGFVQKYRRSVDMGNVDVEDGVLLTQALGGSDLPGKHLFTIEASQKYVFVSADSIYDNTAGGFGIIRMNANGDSVSHFPIDQPSGGKTHRVQAMATDIQDNVYIIVQSSVTYPGARRTELRKFSYVGDTLRTWQLPDGDYVGLSVDRSGAIYYASATGGIDVIAKDSLETAFHYVGPIVSPCGMAGDSLCGLLVSDQRNHLVNVVADQDGDGLCDSWERDGLVNRHVAYRYLLPSPRLDSLDVYVEIDHMQGQALRAVSRDSVVNSYGRHGIVLHVMDGSNDPCTSYRTGWGTAWADSMRAFKLANFGSVGERDSGMVPAKSLAFHYCAMTDTVTGAAGLGETPGNDMIVALGEIGRGSDRPLNVYTRAGAFMHELGHNLGLDHGGGDGLNHKPNYHSVMNYSWDRPDFYNEPWERWVANYSEDELPTLYEAMLVDTAGIKDFRFKDVKVPIGPCTWQFGGWGGYRWTPRKVSSTKSVDWNDDDEDNVCAQCDVNTWPKYLSREDSELEPAQPDSGDTLRGFRDWDHLQFMSRRHRAWYVTMEEPKHADGTPIEERSLAETRWLFLQTLDCNGNAVDDSVDIATGTSLDVNRDMIPDECESIRVEGLAAKYVVCPGGDKDSVSWLLSTERITGVNSANPSLRIFGIIRNSGTTLRAWDSRNRPLTTGDTLWATSYDVSSAIARFRVDQWSGCGEFECDLYAGDTLVARGVTSYIASLDLDAKSQGSVDRFDTTTWHSWHMSGCTGCPNCGDFDATAGLGAGDSVLVVSHLTHHIPRQVKIPNGGDIYEPGEVATISWARGWGDSARVTIRALRDTTSTDSITIATDTLDTGSLSWTVPTTAQAGRDYRIKITHSAGYYKVDNKDVGWDKSDNMFLVLPRKVASISGMAGKTTAAFTWTEPTQAGGAADQYEIRYRGNNETITEANFSSSTRLYSPGITPGAGGTAHCADTSNLASCKGHTLAIKTRKGSLWSRMSSVGSVSTACSGNSAVFCDEEGMMAGGGGGEEEAVRQPLGKDQAGTAVSDTPDSDQIAPAENSLLWGSGESVTDLYRLNGDFSDADGHQVVRIRATGNRRANLDQLSLGVVDHEANLTAIPGEGQVFLGEPGPVVNVTDMAEHSSATLPVDSTGTYAGKAGQYLLVNLGDPQNAGLVVEARAEVSGAKTDSLGLLVQKPAQGGEWTTIATIFPRREFDRSVVSAQGNQTLRLVFLRDYSLRSLGRLTISSTATPQPLTLVSAEQSKTGSVKDAVDASGGESTTIVPGDTLTLTFSGGPATAGFKRDVFLTAKGSYLAPSASPAAILEPSVLTLPPVYQFALGLARPNPSSGSVTIGFTMAQEGPALIRVYDVAGRLVRTLVNGKAAIGPHEIIWDASDDRGRHVGAGVYFYRMDAGAWRSQRKVVFLER